MSKQRVNTVPSNKRTAETRANAIRAAPEEEDGLQQYTIIGAAKLEQRALVWARLGVTYYDETGYPFNNPMLTYEPNGTDIQYDLTLALVPNGSVVSFWLDVKSSDSVYQGSMVLLAKLTPYPSRGKLGPIIHIRHYV